MTINSLATNNSNDNRPMTKAEAEEYLTSVIHYLLKEHICEDLSPHYDPDSEGLDEEMIELAGTIQECFLHNARRLTPAALREDLLGCLVEDSLDLFMNYLCDLAGETIQLNPSYCEYLDEYTKAMQEQDGKSYDKPKLVHAVCVLLGTDDIVQS